MESTAVKRNEIFAEFMLLSLSLSQCLASFSSLCSFLSSPICSLLPFSLFSLSYSVSHLDSVVLYFVVSSIRVQEFRTLYTACMISLFESFWRQLLTDPITSLGHIRLLLQILILGLST